MQRKWIAAASFFACALTIGSRASASPGACGFEPQLDHANRSQIEDYVAFARGETTPSERRACSYYGLGTLYHFMGDYEKAIENYNKAIGWWKTYGDAYEARGDAYALLGKPELASKSYDKAAATTQDTPGELTDRCWTRAIRGAPLDRALTDCNAVLKVYPGDFYVRMDRCFVYLRMGLYDKAIADCTLALADRREATGRLYSSYGHGLYPAGALYLRGVAELAKGDQASGQADVAAAVNSFSRIEKVFALYGIDSPPESATSTGGGDTKGETR